ncbi:MAG TPA: hypothetical protein VGH10_07805 [Actinomycetota bacterium]|jgi:hypothetical protein
MRDAAVDLVKKVMPDSFVHWYRRRRAARRYIRSLGEELYERNTRLDLEHLDERVVAGHPGFYERLAKEILERTEVVLQELDRKIEAVAARQGGDIRALREQVEELREQLERARARR